jgi:hypothetical protein
MPIALADIRHATEDTLQQLVGISEDETLDFKRDNYGTSEKASQVARRSRMKQFRYCDLFLESVTNRLHAYTPVRHCPPRGKGGAVGRVGDRQIFQPLAWVWERYGESVPFLLGTPATPDTIPTQASVIRVRLDRSC